MYINVRSLRRLIREELIKSQFDAINEAGGDKMANSEMVKTLKQGAVQLADMVKDQQGGNYMEIMGALAKASSEDPAQYKMVQKKIASMLGVTLGADPEEGGEGGEDAATDEEKAEQEAKLEL